MYTKEDLEKAFNAGSNKENWTKLKLVDCVEADVTTLLPIFDNWFEKSKIKPINKKPEWLSESIIELAKNTYNSHKTINDGMRVSAASIIKDEAENNGYIITYRKSLEILTKFCL